MKVLFFWSGESCCCCCYHCHRRRRRRHHRHRLRWLLLLRSIAATAGAAAATTAAGCYCCCCWCCRCYCYYYWIWDSIGGDGDGGIGRGEGGNSEGEADEEKERGSIRFTPTRDLRTSPRPLLSEPPLPIERGVSRAFYPSPPPTPFPLASASRPPSTQTFFLILSFAISPSISHWCNFPVGDLYDVKICVVYLAILRRRRFSPRPRWFIEIFAERYRVSETRLFSCQREGNIF